MAAERNAAEATPHGGHPALGGGAPTTKVRVGAGARWEARGAEDDPGHMANGPPGAPQSEKKRLHAPDVVHNTTVPLLAQSWE